MKKIKNEVKEKVTYEDVTYDVYNNAKPYKGKVEKQNYIEYKGNIYKVDGHNVKNKHDERELEVATLLNKTFGGKVKILPNINYPQGIKTPDYIYKNENLDLKQIRSKRAKDCVKTALRNQEEQSHNFIIDNSLETVSDEDIKRQIDEIYKSGKFKWVDTIYLLKGNKFTNIYKRK